MYMQYKYKIFEKIIIILSFLVLFVVCIIFLINSNLKPMYATSISVDQIIKNIKIENQNLKLIAENNTIKNLYNIVYLDNNKYKSYIIDTITGKELSFKDLITNEKDYLSKENELLKLKYPEYIVNGLNNKKVQKVYNIKPNEVTIYYYNYQLDYDYPNELNLTINYNEIKDYLKFEPILDETYENENGYNYQKGVKTVALTFDDGPSKPYNSLILNELAKNKAHATFFMVGTMMNACQNCVLNTYKSGNEIGSHSWEHMNIASKKQDKVKTSLDKVNTLYTKITNDTIKLLRECDAGIKMGVSSIDDVLDYVRDDQFRKCLDKCKDEHEKLKDEIQILLDKYHDDGKNPNAMAKSMSQVKTSMKLMMKESDETIADLMTDGCNMGVKSLNKYLNKYKAADEVSKDITKRLINLETDLTIDIRPYL